MSEVWVVTEYDYNGDEVLGVFTTREAAIARLQALYPNLEVDESTWYGVFEGERGKGGYWSKSGGLELMPLDPEALR